MQEHMNVEPSPKWSPDSPAKILVSPSDDVPINFSVNSNNNNKDSEQENLAMQQEEPRSFDEEVASSGSGPISLVVAPNEAHHLHHHHHSHHLLPPHNRSERPASVISAVSSALSVPTNEEISNISEDYGNEDNAHPFLDERRWQQFASSNVLQRSPGPQMSPNNPKEDQELPDHEIPDHDDDPAIASNSAGNSANPGSVRWSVDLRLVPCQICGASSSGYHFGVISCEGCKGFFRRTMTHNLEHTYTCFNAQSTGIRCRIQALGRKCKKCRFDLCQEMGMTTEGGKTGRHSYLRRIQTHRHVEQLRAENRLLAAPLLRFRRRQKPKQVPTPGAGDNNNNNKSTEPTSSSSAFHPTASLPQQQAQQPMTPLQMARPTFREPATDLFRLMAASSGAPPNSQHLFGVPKSLAANLVYDTKNPHNSTAAAADPDDKDLHLGPINLKRASPGASSNGSATPPDGAMSLPPRKRLLNCYNQQPEQASCTNRSSSGSSLHQTDDVNNNDANRLQMSPPEKKPTLGGGHNGESGPSAAEMFAMGRIGTEQALGKMSMANRMLMAMAMLKDIPTASSGGPWQNAVNRPTNEETANIQDTIFANLRAAFNASMKPSLDRVSPFSEAARPSEQVKTEATAPAFQPSSHFSGPKNTYQAPNELPAACSPTATSPQVSAPASLTSSSQPASLGNLAWLFDCARARFNLTGLALTSELQSQGGNNSNKNQQEAGDAGVSSVLMAASSPYCWPSVNQTDGAASAFVMAARCEWLISSTVRNVKVLETLSNQGRHLISPGMTLDQVWATLMKYFEDNSSQLLQFVRSLFGHQHIHFADRTLLFVESVFPIFFAQMSLDQVEVQRLGLPQGNGVCREVIIKYLASSTASQNSSSSGSVRTARMTIAEFSLMCGLLFFNPDMPGLTEPSRVSAIATEYRRALEIFARRTFSPPEAAEARIAQLNSHLNHFRESPNLFCWLMRNAGVCAAASSSTSTAASGSEQMQQQQQQQPPPRTHSGCSVASSSSPHHVKPPGSSPKIPDSINQFQFLATPDDPRMSSLFLSLNRPQSSGPAPSGTSPRPQQSLSEQSPLLSPTGQPMRSPIQTPNHANPAGMLPNWLSRFQPPGGPSIMSGVGSQNFLRTAFPQMEPSNNNNNNSLNSPSAANSGNNTSPTGQTVVNSLVPPRLSLRP